MRKIRLEGLGGLGANLTGKLIGELAFKYLNKYSRAFSSYGSEKRGSPVKSYIYISDEPIYINTPITAPDILCIFTLSLKNTENITAGISKDTDVIVNTDKSHKYAADVLRLPDCRLWTVDAANIALKCHSRINMALLGAIARASGLFDIEQCIAIVKDNLAANGNIEALKAGYNNVKPYEIKSKYNYIEYTEPKNNTKFGGILPSSGSTITNDLQGCREGVMPFYIREKCIDCGLCESTCPDMVFQFKDGVNLGLDLYHCKGCLRCVEICPTNALTEAKEGEYDKNIGNVNLINKDFNFDKTGYSSLVEGDVYDAQGSTDKSI